jgi:phenylacetic acid degradation operon negative regulatory protein
MKKSDRAEMLDVFFWGLTKLAQPTLANLLMGYEEYSHRSGSMRLIERLRHEDWIAARGRGARAEFTITDKGQQRVRVVEPQPHWERRWDGCWRVVTFDLPETRRNDRKRLWQALRAHKLGFLQRSVWVWPHDVTPILHEIIQVEGVPECFCGFTSRELFLCTDREIVASAWNWKEIGRHHKGYLQHLVANEKSLREARDLAQLARLARIEKQACEHAFLWDPLLPRSLWPDDYMGHTVCQRHQRFRELLGQRLAAVAPAVAVI